MATTFDTYKLVPVVFVLIALLSAVICPLSKNVKKSMAITLDIIGVINLCLSGVILMVMTSTSPHSHDFIVATLNSTGKTLAYAAAFSLTGRLLGRIWRFANRPRG